MLVKIILVTLCCSVLANYYDRPCTRQAVLNHIKRPTYEFSMRLLQRVTIETDAHYVFSPLSTWLQMTALAEGAIGKTVREIVKVTKYNGHKCFKRKLSNILFDLHMDLKNENKRRSIMAIDKFMAVKKSYIKNVANYYGIQTLLLDFNELEKSATEVNEAIDKGTGGAIKQMLYYEDFLSTVLLIGDANNFYSKWNTPFNSAYTKQEPFYSSQGLEIGNVSMMNQKGYFNVREFHHIGAKVLELPCANRRISMLIFVPTDNSWVGEIFYSLQKTTLASIFNLYKRDGVKLVNVTIPKFKLSTEIENLPELIYDMGIKRIFNPRLAELNNISKYNMYASLMTQITQIEIDEEGILAGADFIIKNDTSIEFKVNKPFAFMVVDRKTHFILYAGTYSKPTEF